MTELCKGIQLLPGDMREVLASLEPESVDSCVCDPPYHLASIVKRFGKPDSAPVKIRLVDGQGGSPFARGAKGFMGKEWDGGEIAFEPETWAAVYRVLKPGGYLLAFGAPKNFGFMQVAMAKAGFEIRDVICYIFGSGFPKSHDPKKGAGQAVCRCSSAHRDLSGLRDGENDPARMEEAEQECLLQPVVSSKGPCGASDPVRRQFQREEEPGEGQARATQRGVEGRCNLPESPRELCERSLCEVLGLPALDGEEGWVRDGAQACDGAMDWAHPDANGVRASQGPSAAQQYSGQSGTVAGQSEPQVSGALPNCDRCGKPVMPDGLGSALKPAYEPIIVARKPLDGTIAQNVLKHGTGAINVDACRVDGAGNKTFVRDAGARSREQYRTGTTIGSAVPSDLGRWPANVVHDGSEEVLAAFPETQSNGGGTSSTGFWQYDGRRQPIADGDSGSAARFFYTAKADQDDRLGSKHPTVKPVDLMQWLVRMVTPKGGLVLDPFAGTGTTGEAAFREGMRALLIEREPEYQDDIRRRMQLVLAGPEERRRETIKQKTKDKPPDHGPLWDSMWATPLAETNPEYKEVE